MTLEKTPLAGCVLIQPHVFKDQRGSFFESFNQQKFAQLYGKSVHFVQDNQSISSYGTLRGLHFQQGEYAQAKLVRVISGKVLDVVVDVRKDSPSFGQHHSVELSGENNLQIFIPKGFAHGFVGLSEKVIFEYKCDAYYQPSAEAGIRFDDPDLNIDWKIPSEDMILSAKDQKLPLFNQLEL
ncbi:dTDP-4-dehydrorhamnose 3,5-epimerase [Psychroflexus maritimus]|uniref:dTDP-4-dehydrorhamnose 3,5-epimerase n=1 Tax=Psychroflexus maritimus TaxID=2714865 RepID=A0A967ADH6_9FLAO|nr:dTDP-4-dehydrorhamnose 3,5-epimerase [Psychroflexus maritimus]NGZ90101.1 dTDP-4-dehydrorhamnose 3,5-epimerase [Psychroflexus maritimus]